jgi:hypothetical protein
MKKLLAISGLAAMVAACASLSPHARVEKRFVEFGLTEERAGCLADELDDRLDREDLAAVADYIDGLNNVDEPGEALNALLRIENPRAVAAIAPASLACALNRD